MQEFSGIVITGSLEEIVTPRNTALVRDACGFGNEEAANHSLASLKHNATITDVGTVCGLLSKIAPNS